MANTATRTGHLLAKILGIKLQSRNSICEELSRGESVFSIQSTDAFIEQEPTSAEWVVGLIPDRHDVLAYTRSLFPFTHWIGRYNLQWFAGDMIAGHNLMAVTGITIGAVVVPQGMAYAMLAQLDPQFGLYSSFMGVLIYWFFATSKDITIGPVAVMSTIVGNIVLEARKTHPDIESHVIASALAVIAGCIIVAIGLARCGWIVDLISLTSIAAFMTGSSINIAVGQVPALMGITVPNSRAATYLVVIESLKHIGTTNLNAAIGLTAITMLYTIRSACKYGAKRWPSRQKAFFFASTLRTVFVILLYTLISWLVNRHEKKAKFKVLGPVPRGFKNAAVPQINIYIIKAFASQLPATVIVLLIEHIAISKSFGRVNNYIINPSQEMVAIGISNILGPFLGAYPATGSFSRTAIKSKAGVRTPLAGLITAVVVLLAIYALPAVFKWIPNAALAAVIIHAVGDLITPPNTIYQFWRVSPLEVLIFFVGVFVTIFSSIENGIYCTISISFAVLVFRILKARGRFLGRVTAHSVLGDHVLGGDPKIGSLGGLPISEIPEPLSTRNIFLPIEHADGSNPDVQVKNPYPGVFIYRFSEGFNYPNANHYLDHLTNRIFANTRRTNMNSYPRPGDRPWNDPGPRRGETVDTTIDRPTLKAVILDFSSVNNVDITSVQQLIDVRNQLDRYTSPEVVDWHFSCINNRWTKRALVSAGFGCPNQKGGIADRWKPLFSVAEIGGSDSAARAAETLEHEKGIRRQPTREDHQQIHRIENDIGLKSAGSSGEDIKKGFQNVSLHQRTAVVHGLNRPLFHIDLTSALQSAIANVEARQTFESRGAGIGHVP
ncbi:MAG: Sulfate permease 2 [Claussenomyces sp. TS43310]|nr:MAG: Sulfate permease 2 [Claussenomyces sp. TS43310]